MTTQKSTKRALLLSALSLLMCVSMLIGSTFAWFTDSVTSGRNKIVAGNLDVVLEYKTPDSTDWTEVTSDTVLFGEDSLWEPGHTEVVALRIRNAGTLALKYDLATTVYEEVAGTNVAGKSFKLSDYLEVGYSAVQADGQVGDIFMGILLGSRDQAAKLANSEFGESVEAPTPYIFPGEAHVCALAITMPETVGNEANYKHGTTPPSISFGVTVLATQAVSEQDSFGSDYDKDATYPELVYTADDIANALAEGGTFKLASDVVVSKQLSVAKNKEVILDLGGNTISGAFDNQGGSALINNQGTLTIKNGTVVSLAEYPDVDWGTEGFPTYATNTISNKGTLVIENGTVIENQTNVGGASYAIDNYAGATLTVEPGAVVKAQDVAIRMFSGSATAENKVVINGGTITGKRAVWVQLPSNNSAVAPLTTLEINGGELKSTSEWTIYSYSYGNSFANTNITITGGTFEKHVAFGGGYKGDKEKVTVTGGVFNGDLGRYLENDGWEDITKPQ